MLAFPKQYSRQVCPRPRTTRTVGATYLLTSSQDDVPRLVRRTAPPSSRCPYLAPPAVPPRASTQGIG